ncbi:NAD(P)H-dependent oxidoreductase [Metamycoplasma buccale]|uniref:NAD(P)H-dependent oxidoreductase n=1 Tax=Metamycoplasma buccale TaxID=55602 RepID=UPI00398F2253
MKKFYIIMGHPNVNSFNGYLANEYEKKLTKLGYQVRRQNLGELKFDPILHKGYKEIQDLEDDLVKAQENIKWADEIIIIYPLWWGTIPALLKGFIDRIFLPGFAFKYHNNDPFWDKLLKGKTARIFSTCDSPEVYQNLWLLNTDFILLKRAILGFSGIKVKQTKRISNLIKKDLKQCKEIVAKIISKIK